MGNNEVVDVTVKVNPPAPAEEVVVFTFDIAGSRSLQRECPDIWQEITVKKSRSH